MSTDIISVLKSSPAVQTGLDEDTLAVAGGRSGGSKRISIKGGVFRKMVGGKEVGAIEDRHMNVILVKMAHDPSRTYYEGAYKEGEKVSPVCWSNNSKTPDDDVKNPLAKSCNECEKSVKGSGQGGTGTACRLSWRTAVVLPNDPGGDVMQMVLPATSCFGKEDNGRWPFRPYVQMLANHNISAGRVITKMQFDTKSPVPKVVFSPVGAIEQEDVDTIQQQAKSAAAESAIKLTVFQTDEIAEPFESAPVVQEVVQEEAPVKEPVLREKEGEAKGDESNVADIVKKWSKKK
jgi:hypothetical protein